MASFPVGAHPGLATGADRDRGFHGVSTCLSVDSILNYWLSPALPLEQTRNRLRLRFRNLQRPVILPQDLQTVRNEYFEIFFIRLASPAPATIAVAAITVSVLK